MWNKFMEKLGSLLPEVETLYPYPEARLRFNTQTSGLISEVRTVCVSSARVSRGLWGRGRIRVETRHCIYLIVKNPDVARSLRLPQEARQQSGS
jgi:hypothetical protein